MHFWQQAQGKKIRRWALRQGVSHYSCRSLILPCGIHSRSCFNIPYSFIDFCSLPHQFHILLESSIFLHKALWSSTSLHTVFRKLHITWYSLKGFHSFLKHRDTIKQPSIFFQPLPKYFQHPSNLPKGAQGPSRHSQALLSPFQTSLHLFQIFPDTSPPFEDASRHLHAFPDKRMLLPDSFS